MIRRLYIDNQLVDIDEKTVISITYQYFNLLSDGINSPITRRCKVSNTFTIPKSAKNLSIIGYAGHINFASTKVYQRLNCNYFIGNDKYVNNAKLKIESVGERISCSIVEKNSIWDNMKKMTWTEFKPIIYSYLNIKKQHYSEDPLHITKYTFGEFIEAYNSYDNDAILLSAYTDLSSGSYPIVFNNYWIPEGYTDFFTNKGSNVWVYVGAIFHAIELEFGMAFGTATSFDSNIFEDSYAKRICIPIRDIIVAKLQPDGYEPDYLFQFSSIGTYGNQEDAVENQDKTVYDFVLAFCQYFNVEVDESEDDIIKLRRFDEISTNGTVIDLSGKYKPETKIFKPIADGYNQVNYIRFANKYEGASENINAKIIESKNENLDVVAELFSIDAYMPNFFVIGNDLLPNMRGSEPLTSFCFMYAGELSDTGSYACSLNWAGVVDSSTTATLINPTIYSLDDEYQLIETIMEYPKVFEIQRWITLAEIKKIKPFTLVYIEELGGTFYINKITNFNPYLSKQPAKLELIKINDSKP